MSQPFLFDPPPDTARPHKAVNVPRTSVLAYQERPRDARAAEAVRVLAWCYERTGQLPTSAELASWVSGGGVQAQFASALEQRMWYRRGLSDALKLGLVEHAGTRKCAVSGRQCVTWRVRTR